MARYVDVDNLIEYLTIPTGHNATCDGCCDIDCVDCIRDEVIKNLPTADVVEVKCRCEDCKHYKRYGSTSLIYNGKNIKCGWCYLRGKTDEEHRMLPFDFCSYGERKEE